jgi:hypothetical protein
LRSRSRCHEHFIRHERQTATDARSLENSTQKLTENLAVWGTQVGLKVLGAIVLWVFGRRLIHFAAGALLVILRPFKAGDVAQLHGAVDHNAALRLLKERIAKIPNVRTDPAPVVEIREFTAFGPRRRCDRSATTRIAGSFFSTAIESSRTLSARPTSPH